MINSKGSVVVGDERAEAGLVGEVVVPDGGGEGEQALQHAGGHAGVGTSAVLFEVELAFEGVVDRFDQLAQRFEQPGTGTGHTPPGWSRPPNRSSPPRSVSTARMRIKALSWTAAARSRLL